MTLPPIDTIHQVTITDTVFHTLRTHIINQSFKPGQRLQVDELVDQLGVSRTPVKDALNLLAAEGLVRIMPRRGTFVIKLTVQDVVETYEVRQALELAAAERLVTSITADGLAALEQAMLAVDAAKLAPHDIEDHVRKNLAFHELFVRLAGNSKLFELYQSLNAAIQITRIHHYRSSNWQHRLDQEQLEHRAIMRALRDKDGLALQTAIREHLTRAKQSLIADMEGEGFAVSGDGLND